MSDEPSYVPSEIDLKLRLGISRLLYTKYRPHYGDQSKFLCAGIVNWVLVEPPGNEAAQTFVETNRSLIERESMNLHLDPKLALALSSLRFYANLVGAEESRKVGGSGGEGSRVKCSYSVCKGNLPYG